jgi:hypothetical protein
MNVYLVNFKGHYLGGEMIVVDETKRKAFNQAKKEIIQMGLQSKNEDFSLDDVTQIDTSTKQVILIDNGDY